jgi:carboxypeptidase Taq
MELVRKLGFDFDAGDRIFQNILLLQISAARMFALQRGSMKTIWSMTWSCIHELGHALYEQGLPEEEYGLPLGEYASLSIHESQSRLWENNVGRSSRFGTGISNPRETFPDQFENIDVSTFYKGINKVQPTFIRTEADELTYHFHVMIRYELEKMLVEQNLSTKDIPAFWNEKYHQYLGLTVPDDKTGCLQDVHWSHGSLGYFPTYSLGSFYAAQFTQVPKSS